MNTIGPQFNIDTYNPYGTTLYSHQRITMRFIIYFKRCFVFDDIGTGKTLSSLSACDFLMLNKKIKRVLIVSPISVLRATWASHILRFFPGRRFTVLHGNKDKRLANLALDVDFYLINTDGIKVIEMALLRRKFDVIIIDESTAYSSHKSNRSKTAWRLCDEVKSVIAMTGNPIPNDTLQSFGQSKLISMYRVKYFTKFRDQLKIKFDEFTYIDRENAIDLAYSILQPSIRHKLEDCIDLPPITYEYRDIPMSIEQEKYYREMARQCIVWLQSGERVKAVNAGVKAMKLLQISSGLIINEGKATHIDHKHRLDELKHIKSQVKKLIIFANFTETINQLLIDLPGSEKIDGSVSSNDRLDIINRFQSGDLDILLGHPGAISHGVTLTSSNTIVWWSPPLSNEHYIQCNGRIRRASQTRPQLVIKFRSTKIEARRYDALERKESVSQSLLALVEAITNPLYDGLV